jgi:hypothetical protein
MDMESSLLDLHDVIQDAVGFDRDHLFEFFGGRNWQNRTIVFEDSCEGKDLLRTYSRITIEQVYPLPKGCELVYHFDFGDDWFFQIKKSRKKPKDPEEGVEYPRIIESVGPNPEQYPGAGDWY